MEGCGTTHADSMGDILAPPSLLCLNFRWEGAAQQGTAWLGQALDPVRIDVLGKFTFVLVKVENRQGSSRLLVRGRQGGSQAALVQDVEKEVSATEAVSTAVIASVACRDNGYTAFEGGM